MKKTIFGYVIPITIILVIAAFFIYLKFQSPKSDLSYYELKWQMFKDYWYLSLTAGLAYLYMQFLVPKIFTK
jgi:hypothetical protein